VPWADEGDPQQMEQTSTLTIGAPKEACPGERRVAITPPVVAGYVKAGFRVLVEADAGLSAGFADKAYTDRGAEIVKRDVAMAADVLAVVRVLDGDPASPDRDRLRPGQVVIGMASPLAAPQVAAAVAERGAVLFALELVPRTTRAQSMDVLSSQANIAGYKAVLLAAAALPKMAPMLTTAAGTIAPAKVFIIGAGVAGLSAIATARRLGAVVEAYDVRTAVKEEVESLGARFIELPLETGQEGSGSGAYATQMSEEQVAKQRELMAKTIAGSDVVITTAQVQGAKAPVLVTKEMVAGMSSGSVIVDLAADQGGNCEGSVAGDTVDVGGVTIIGPTNLPGSVPHDASLTYAKNIANFVALIVADKALNLDVDDVIVRETVTTHDGQVVHTRVREALGLAPLPAPPPPGPSPTVEPSQEAAA
jgi:H+-translocating NAD(P) transhydrogenase subunit alpha